MVKGHERLILVTKKPCHELEQKLEPIHINIQGRVFSIAPKGYLHQSEDTKKKPICLIGIESIPDKENHYRLGLTFLKNFYTALDFENNYIIVGINNMGPSKENDVRSEEEFNKYREEKKAEEEEEQDITIWVVVIFILVVLIFFVVKRYRDAQQEKRVTFAKAQR